MSSKKKVDKYTITIVAERNAEAGGEFDLKFSHDLADKDTSIAFFISLLASGFAEGIGI